MNHGRQTCWYNYAVVMLRWRGKFVPNDGVSGKSESLAAVIVRDVHFWIPVLVLLGGLAVLRWIS
jgi:hypothetical protein